MVIMEKIVQGCVDTVKTLVVTEQMETVLQLYALLDGKDRTVTLVSLIKDALRWSKGKLNKSRNKYWHFKLEEY